MGVERIFASPGSDWAPLWEALARPHGEGEFPEYISSRYEETAVGMATGYFKATGKLPAVVDQPELARDARGGDIVVPYGTDWLEGYEEKMAEIKGYKPKLTAAE